jgi:hypothetical protein
MPKRPKNNPVVRIRYKTHSTNKNVKVSEPLTSKNGTCYISRIKKNDDNTYSYEIYNKTSGRIVKRGEGYKNYNHVGVVIKEYLEKLGVLQKREIRRRTFGQCPKGHTQDKERIVRKTIQKILQEDNTNEESN